MERIFKIKTKSDRDPRTQYPSERRYSASTVIGLSVVFLQMFLYSILMGTLIIYKMTIHASNSTTDPNITNETADMQGLFEKLGRDLGHQNTQYYINVPTLVCAGCFIMALGYFLSFITGIFSWRQWYIDHNITFFFLSSTLSALTSSLSLLLSLLTCANMDFNYDDYTYEVKPQLSPITFSLALNIIILSFLGVIWSFLATRISYKGMKTNYPDDMIFSKGGRHVEVNIIKKGNKNGNIYPPDIISHFPVGDKLTKYLPKKENSNLPKAESNFEYQQRVNKFLSGKPECTENQ